MGSAGAWFSVPETNELWSRWKGGELPTSIATAMQKPFGATYRIVVRHGGIAPAPRKRSPRGLQLAEREEISRGLASHASIRAIARGLKRDAGTISREIQRNGGPTDYRAADAEAAAWRRASRAKRCRLAMHGRLRRVVARKLALQWSPQQIAEWLQMTYPTEPTMQVSHETIYRTLYVQARGALKKELVAHLRRHRPRRRSRQATGVVPGRGQIPDAVSISARPAEAADRAIPGHWEGDLIAGAKNSHIATLVERHSRFVVLVKVDGKDTVRVVDALIKRVKRLPTALKASLAWDRGTEMSQHKRFTIATDLQVYFCDPQSPWQRGSNENTNGLLRQYFPHGTELTQFTQTQLNAIARRLNERPRETLGFRTPAAVLAPLLLR